MIRTWVVLTFRMVVVWADVLPKVYRAVASCSLVLSGTLAVAAHHTCATPIL